MLTTRLLIQDAADGEPVAGAQVEVRVDVVARYREQIDIDDLPDILRSTQVGKPTGVTLLLPDFANAVRVTTRAGSDATGLVRVSLDLGAAFAEVGAQRRDGQEPVDVGALVSVGIEVAGVDFDASFVKGVTEPDGEDFFGANSTVTRNVPVDFGFSIVGHVGESEANLFFRLNAQAGDQELSVCEVTAGSTGALIATVVLHVEDSLNNTAHARIPGLEADTSYLYRVHQRALPDADTPGAGRRVLAGSFRTADPGADRLEFVFASCHNPVERPGAAQRRSLNRWAELAGRDDYEMLLLIGDQIYSDGIEEPDQRTWLEAYLDRYDQFWAYPEVRNVFRRTPTYMILDDHDVIDDYAVVPVEPPEREIGALQAYDVFQKSHGVAGNQGSTAAGGAAHYSFRRGPAAFFMVDNRTRRAADPDDAESPILGSRQRRDLQAWAREVRESDVDVVFVAVPVPVAWLPVEEVRGLIEEFKDEAAIVGALLAAPFGFLGVAVGGLAGHMKAKSILDSKGLGNLTDRDLADMWTLEANQRDLAFLLDLLFDIANDIRADGTAGPRPRAVFLLGGDVHAGAFHTIRSVRAGDGHDHRRNRFMIQVTASPISNTPAADEVYFRIVKHIQTGVDVGGLDIVASVDSSLSVSPDQLVKRVFGEQSASFVLDDKLDLDYVADFFGLLPQRNFGKVKVERVRGRVYRFEFGLEGEGGGQPLSCPFLLDLDAPSIRPIRDHAEFVRQSVPRRIPPVQRVEMSVTMRNAGTSTWPAGYRLSALAKGWGVAAVPVGREVAPGEVVEIRFAIATLSPGDRAFQWQMERPFVGRFGQPTPRIIVEVTAGDGDPCTEIERAFEGAEARLRDLQDLLKTLPGGKEDIVRQIKEVQAELAGLEARARRLGCD